MTDKINLKDVREALEGATPGPWKMETVPTSCGTCHRIGPFPRPSYSPKPEGWACVYDDYPPGTGSTDLISNARLIAMAPAMAEALLMAIEAIREIAGQKKTDELETEYDVEVADFEGGYDMCIDRARAFLERVEEGE